MKWTGITEFLAMGGYGLHVWGSYAVTAALIGIELALIATRYRAARRRPPEPRPQRDSP